MKKKSTLTIKWLLFSISGILLMGFGLSLLGESIIIKAVEGIWWKWFIIGTIALIFFFAGLSLFGQAVVIKTLLYRGKADKKKKKD